jgi:hypothetical protein
MPALLAQKDRVISRLEFRFNGILLRLAFEMAFEL